MSETIVAALSALGTGVLSLIGVYLANRKSSALIAYRLEQLEKKVAAHNDLVTRMTAVESRLDAVEDSIKELKGLVIHAS